MSPRRFLKVATVVSGAGVLFSGYLSGTRYLTDQCAFDEPCPLFMGYPACYVGFAMFLALFGVTFGAWVANVEKEWPAVVDAVVSVLGVLFAGWFTVGEVRGHAGIPTYGLGLPTCSYGLIVFVAMLGLSAWQLPWLHRGTHSPSAVS